MRGREGRIRVRRGLFHLVLIAVGIVAGQVGASPPTAREATPGSSELEITETSTGRAAGSQSTYQAQNPKNNLSVLFQSTGVSLSPRSAQEPKWSIDLSLSGIGLEGSPANPGTARLSIAGNRIDYDFGAVRQWYRNEESGLEQGFVLVAPAKPAAQGEAKILLDLSVGGNVEIRRD
ncbi:MAG TPA: hypothetical protein VGR38_02890, partial [Candidatus Polarisedimenticolia bacterium]|nr:hypothetical protein [Candidatus Polarisedimenticolia bacterium]